MGNLSPSFSIEEFIPRELLPTEFGKAKPYPDFIDALQRIRDKCKLPVAITDGIRSPASNIKLGIKLKVKSFKKSYHIPRRVPKPGTINETEYRFMCCDFTIRQLNPIQMLVLALEEDAFKRGGIGFYPKERVIHVDMRPDGPARWARIPAENDIESGKYVSLMEGLKWYGNKLVL